MGVSHDLLRPAMRHPHKCSITHVDVKLQILNFKIIDKMEHFKGIYCLSTIPGSAGPWFPDSLGQSTLFPKQLC